MKKAVTISSLLLLIITTEIFSGCSGKDGAPGATGPAGNANVKNYDLTIKPGDWKYNASYQEWYYDYPCSANSQSAVLGYVMSGNGKQSLPYVFTLGNCRYTMATNLFTSSPYIEFQFTNFTSATTAPTSDEFFYLVIIPPAMKKAHPNTDWNNYAEVMKVISEVPTVNNQQ